MRICMHALILQATKKDQILGLISFRLAVLSKVEMTVYEKYYGFLYRNLGT
jgi:hypothetical protein